jgi:hypothetical protein
MGSLRAAYPWQESYLAALYETDRSLVMGRIYEALSAIEQRRLSPVKSEQEQFALAIAEAGVRGLITQLTGDSRAN